MKKLSILAVAFAALTFAACGGNKNAQNAEQADSTKSFEQEQIEAAIKMHFDSLASELGKLKQLPVVQKDGVIKLTDAEKQVKPDYLLDAAVAENATTLAEKYRMVSALGVDKKVAAMYDMPFDAYEKAITKLLADINDPSFKDIQDGSTIYETTQTLYDSMQANGRINYFWQLVSASLVEELYVMSQNTEKFLSVFNDDAVANVTFRIILLLQFFKQKRKFFPDLVKIRTFINHY